MLNFKHNGSTIWTEEKTTDFLRNFTCIRWKEGGKMQAAQKKEGLILISNLQSEQSSQSNNCWWRLTPQAGILSTILASLLLVLAPVYPHQLETRRKTATDLLAWSKTNLSIIPQTIIVFTIIVVHLNDWFHRSYKEWLSDQLLSGFEMMMCSTSLVTWKWVTYSAAWKFRLFVVPSADIIKIITVIRLWCSKRWLPISNSR